MLPNFDKAYFFGDSLSDTGNIAGLTGDQVPFPP